MRGLYFEKKAQSYEKLSSRRSVRQRKGKLKNNFPAKLFFWQSLFAGLSTVVSYKMLILASAHFLFSISKHIRPRACVCSSEDEFRFHFGLPIICQFPLAAAISLHYLLNSTFFSYTNANLVIDSKFYFSLFDSRLTAFYAIFPYRIQLQQRVKSFSKKYVKNDTFSSDNVFGVEILNGLKWERGGWEEVVWNFKEKLCCTRYPNETFSKVNMIY